MNSCLPFLLPHPPMLKLSSYPKFKRNFTAVIIFTRISQSRQKTYAAIQEIISTFFLLINTADNLFVFSLICFKLLKAISINKTTTLYMQNSEKWVYGCFSALSDGKVFSKGIRPNCCQSNTRHKAANLKAKSFLKIKHNLSENDNESRWHESCSNGRPRNLSLWLRR